MSEVKRWSCALLFMLSLHASGQTTMAIQDSTSLRVKKTTIWAACVPGSGQAINRQFWKVPIVWGGLGYAGWAVWDNSMEMRKSIDDLIAVTDDDPNTVPTLTDGDGNFYSESQLEERALFYRRNRDLSVLGGLIVYGLQVLDANTGAMLKMLDTSDALAANCTMLYGVPTVQLSWHFNLGRDDD